jgi:hypothetical protein
MTSSEEVRGRMMMRTEKTMTGRTKTKKKVASPTSARTSPRKRLSSFLCSRAAARLPPNGSLRRPLQQQQLLLRDELLLLRRNGASPNFRLMAPSPLLSQQRMGRRSGVPPLPVLLLRQQLRRRRRPLPEPMRMLRTMPLEQRQHPLPSLRPWLHHRTVLRLPPTTMTTLSPLLEGLVAGAYRARGQRARGQRARGQRGGLEVVWAPVPPPLLLLRPHPQQAGVKASSSTPPKQ